MPSFSMLTDKTAYAFLVNSTRLGNPVELILGSRRTDMRVEAAPGGRDEIHRHRRLILRIRRFERSHTVRHAFLEGFIRRPRFDPEDQPAL